MATATGTTKAPDKILVEIGGTIRHDFSIKVFMAPAEYARYEQRLDSGDRLVGEELAEKADPNGYLLTDVEIDEFRKSKG